ncbi:hypothetical protein HPB48_008160 [Haemaphysalis longicornis]|uniref:Uncharacterized protein n=1 Tax=Haemaphysalis longicornis TaxID=44386 RepID=A0A9J6FFR2_HAELO|nr:hypothetical protein HPB48_008160 [Haemaphysalis longicornis]
MYPPTNERTGVADVQTSRSACCEVISVLCTLLPTMARDEQKDVELLTLLLFEEATIRSSAFFLCRKGCSARPTYRYSPRSAAVFRKNDSIGSLESFLVKTN